MVKTRTLFIFPPSTGPGGAGRLPVLGRGGRTCSDLARTYREYCAPRGRNYLQTTSGAADGACAAPAVRQTALARHGARGFSENRGPSTSSGQALGHPAPG
jgi:hypothetical protein